MERQQQQQQQQQKQLQQQQPITHPSNGDDCFDELMNNGPTFPYVVVKTEEDLDLNGDRDEKTSTAGGDGMLYLCDVCSDGFPTPLSLLTHKQQQHSNTICGTLIQQQQLQPQPQQQQQQQQHSHTLIKRQEQYSNTVEIPFTGQYTPDNALPTLTVSEAKEENSTGFSDGTRSEFAAREGGSNVACVVGVVAASSTHSEFECNVCKLTFADEEYLRRHKVRCKDNSTSKFRCSWCERGFTTKGSLELHVSAVHLKKKVHASYSYRRRKGKKAILKIENFTFCSKGPISKWKMGNGDYALMTLNLKWCLGRLVNLL